jgi:hypothetical protein
MQVVAQLIAYTYFRFKNVELTSSIVGSLFFWSIIVVRQVNASCCPDTLPFKCTMQSENWRSCPWYESHRLSATQLSEWCVLIDKFSWRLNLGPHPHPNGHVAPARPPAECWITCFISNPSALYMLNDTIEPHRQIYLHRKRIAVNKTNCFSPYPQLRNLNSLSKKYLKWSS